MSLDDVELEADDEGSLCSRYEVLLRNPLYFARISGRKKKLDDSLDELRVGTQPNQTIGYILSYFWKVLIELNRLDTEMDTPRMKYKVAAVSNDVRHQIQFSVQELFI